MKEELCTNMLCLRSRHDDGKKSFVPTCYVHRLRHEMERRALYQHAMFQIEALRWKEELCTNMLCLRSRHEDGKKSFVPTCYVSDRGMKMERRALYQHATS